MFFICFACLKISMEDWWEMGVSRGQQRFKTNGFSGGALNAQLNFWGKQSQVSVGRARGLSWIQKTREGDPQAHVSELKKSETSALSLQVGMNCRIQLIVVWSQGQLAWLSCSRWADGRHHRDSGTNGHSKLVFPRGNIDHRPTYPFLLNTKR